MSLNCNIKDSGERTGLTWPERFQMHAWVKVRQATCTHTPVLDILGARYLLARSSVTNGHSGSQCSMKSTPSVVPIRECQVGIIAPHTHKKKKTQKNSYSLWYLPSIRYSFMLIISKEVNPFQPRKRKHELSWHGFSIDNTMSSIH